MKIVKVKGGLGNQLFQYAFGKRLNQIVDDDVKYDMSSYQYLAEDSIRRPRIMKFNVNLKIATQDELNALCLFSHKGKLTSTKYRIGIGLEAALNRKYYFEKDRAYRNPESLQKYSYFDGYWQSWRTIDKVWSELKEELIPNYSINAETQKMIDKVSNHNSVFVGVRKGDYTDSINHYGEFRQNYYDKAMNYILDRVPNPVFYIFSNDISWVKNNLSFNGKTVVYREPKDIIDDFEDLLIMANCRHSIMVNSTYHWWGAKLKDYEGKIVVAPSKWFFDDKPIDILPPHWVKMS